MSHLYEIFEGEELKIAEKIQRRRYQMLVHSYIYYELNENLISDSQWSSWAMELVGLQSNHPDIAEQVVFADDFADWDGSSGAFFTYRDKPNIVSIANILLGSKQSKTNTLFTPTKQKASPLFAPKQSKPITNKPSPTKKKLF